MKSNHCLNKHGLITGRNDVVAKVMFLLVSVILSTGGVCLSACWDAATSQEGGTPQPRRPPLPRRHPPVPRRPPCLGDPPQKETPQKEAPQEGGTPSQGDPLPRRLPQKEAPPQEGDPPPGPHLWGKLRGIRSRPTPKGEIEGDQIQPPPPHAGIWSMSGRYASYWNAFLVLEHVLSCFQ